MQRWTLRFSEQDEYLQKLGWRLMIHQSDDYISQIISSYWKSYLIAGCSSVVSSGAAGRLQHPRFWESASQLHWLQISNSETQDADEKFVMSHRRRYSCNNNDPSCHSACPHSTRIQIALGGRNTQSWIHTHSGFGPPFCVAVSPSAGSRAECMSGIPTSSSPTG